MLRIFAKQIACVTIFVALSGPVLAETRALLVGVGDYLHLDADLRGPPNDVGLMRDALRARGVPGDNIDILAGGETPVPTRAAILGGLDRLAAVSGSGDTVIFYFSGHGSQIEDLTGDEAGGFDEIFLPADAQGWNGALGAVENAIYDDEFRVKAQAILSTGAALVAVLDACHSATGFRALGGAGVARTVTPGALGVPESGALARAKAEAAAPLQGDFAFLYSSQSDERSFEFPLGDMASDDAWFGDFTLHLTRVLGTQGARSWREAWLATVASMRGGNGASSQTPDAEGPLLDAPLPGAIARTSDGTWQSEGATLWAGLLQGVNAGAVFEIAAAGDPGVVLGRAGLSDVAPTKGTLTAQGFALPGTGIARLVSPGLPPVLRLSPPRAADDGDYADLLAQLAAVDLDGVEIGAAVFDRGLVLVEGALAVTGRDGVLDARGAQSSARFVPGQDDVTLVDFLIRVRLIHRLELALQAAGGSGFGVPGAGLKVKSELRAGRAGGQGCRASNQDTPRQPLPIDGRAGHCDELWLTLTNTSRTAQDVTVIYLGADLSISALWPGGASINNRIPFGESREIGARLLSPDRAVAERVLVIAVPARDGAPRTELSGLAFEGLTRSAAASSDAEIWLATAIDPERAARGYSGFGKLPGIKTTRIDLIIAPNTNATP